MTHRTRTRIPTLLSGLALLVFAFCAVAAPAEGQAVKFIRIGTGNQTGTWPPLGIKMAEILNKNVKGINVTSLLGAGADNIKNIQNGRIEMGFSSTETEAKALAGESPFNGKQDRVRHLFTMYPIVAQFAVSRGSEITSYADLVKRPYRINANTRNSTTNVVFREILSAYEITLDDIGRAGGAVSYVEYSDGVSQMQDGTLDLTGAIGPVPHNVILQLVQNPGVRLLPVDKARAERISRSLPGYFPAVIKKGSYKGIDQDVLTVGVGTTALASADLPDDLVYQMMEAIFGEIDQIHALFPSAKGITLEDGPTQRIFPIHPGAKRFYEAKGIKVE